ncbi:hypothetical protein PV08_12064 [Exophiala spinifera]|uniref:Uncharacterized protein n=1 Tax=Exophiala spinifera TaxID=91928 RepID=A0A0D1Z9M9_9EURO|nr:uncharacterized protein PV08_12064 [Exophiala spinifera]KIW09677.1 hypothetical protein PV08_12064 [Exophiala spinifera]
MAAWLAYTSTILDRLTELRNDVALRVVLKCWQCFSLVDDGETPTTPWASINETGLINISGPTEALRVHLQFLLPSETSPVVFHHIRVILMSIVYENFCKQVNTYEPEHRLIIHGKTVGLEVYMAILGLEIDEKASNESEYLVNHLQTIVGVGISLQKDLIHLPQELKQGGTANFIILKHLRERGRKLTSGGNNVHDYVKAILDTVKSHNQLHDWAFESYKQVRKSGRRKDILQARTLYHLLGAHWRWRCKIEGYEQC